MKKLIFYQSWFNTIGGVETMAYNWCWWMRKFFDITVLYEGGDVERILKMAMLVKTEKYDDKKEYKCDVFLRNSVWGKIPRNIKADKMIEMRHANYKYLYEKGELFKQYRDMGIKNIIGCGEYVSKMSNEILHDDPITIKNILLPRKETKKIIRLISCTRLNTAKGWDRMLKMMQMMRDANIKFEWKIFTNSKQKCSYEEVHFYEQRYDIWDYLADADYTVLLSDSEGLPYTVQESLQYQVPCIVTDVGGCTELVKDGINGYVVPLDMNFDINKILEIPTCPEYDNHALEDWLKYFGFDDKINKKEIIKELEKEEKNIMVKVKAIINFFDIKENEDKFKDLSSTNKDGTPIKETQHIWVCDKDRAKFLAEKGAVEILEVIKEEEIEPLEAKIEFNEEKVKPKTTIKKTTRKRKNKN